MTAKRMTTRARLLPWIAAAAALVAGCATQPNEPAPMPGPQGGRGTPAGCAADKFADDALLGKSEAEAVGSRRRLRRQVVPVERRRLRRPDNPGATETRQPTKEASAYVPSQHDSLRR